MIKISSVHKSFNNQTILKNINFSVEPGERVSLIGPGGSGKTLILKIMLGLVAPDGGTTSLMGINLHESSSTEIQKVLRNVGMAFQQGGLFDFMTVKENLFFAMENMTELNHAQMLEKTRYLLQAVKLGRTENMFPFELSGGMKRRVGIARALCTDPDIAIFDEPTSGLDPVTSTIILNMISDLATEGDNQKALLIATSNVEIAIRFAKRVIVINEGEVVADGSWQQLLVSGPEWVQNFLGVRFIGLDLDYAKGLDLPEVFIRRHWQQAQNDAKV